MQVSHVLVLVATISLAVGCSGQAQQAGTTASAEVAATALTEAEDSELMIQPLGLTVGDVEEDADLLNQAGEEVGAIESVLVDANQRPVAISAEVGSFVGSEERIVVIGLDQLRADEEGDLVTALSNDELLRLPSWEG